jgi:sphinganine-1-phosphate aldolase
VRDVPGVYVLGEPELSVLALGSRQFNILMLGAEMTKRGWNLNSLQYPASVHISVTYLTVRAADDFVRDVREIAAKLLADPHAKEEGMAAMYGMAAAIPDRSLIGEIAAGFIDALYLTPEEKVPGKPANGTANGTSHAAAHAAA